MPLHPRHQLLARLGEDYEHKGRYLGNLSVEAKLDMDRPRLRDEKGRVHGVGLLHPQASVGPTHHLYKKRDWMIQTRLDYECMVT